MADSQDTQYSPSRGWNDRSSDANSKGGAVVLSNVTIPTGSQPVSDDDGDGDDQDALEAKLGDICPECQGKPGR